MAQKSPAASATEAKKNAQNEAEAAAAAAREGGDRKADAPENVHDLYLADGEAERFDTLNANLHYGTLGQGEDIRDSATVVGEAGAFVEVAEQSPSKISIDARAIRPEVEDANGPRSRTDRTADGQAEENSPSATTVSETVAFEARAAVAARGAQDETGPSLPQSVAPPTALPFAEINNPPTASPVSLGGVEDQPVIIRASDLLAGASDPDGQPLTIAALSVDPAQGQLVDNHDGTWTFTPTANFNGTVSFTYTATDGQASATSTATLAVAAVNDAPVATPVSLGGINEDGAFLVRAADLLAGASDVDGDALSIAALSVDPAQGQLVDNHDGTWTFTPTANFNGSVTFSYTVSDGAASATSTALLNVNAVNDAPTDLLVSGTLAIGETVTQGGVGVAAYNPGGVVVATLSASDQDGDALHYVLASDASGKFEIVGNEVRVRQGAVIDFETDTHFNLVVRAVDPLGAYAEQALTVQVLDREGNYVGTAANNTVYGSSEEDVMRGGAGNDSMWGRDGNDQIYGEAGNDTLQGEGGDDVLDGGDGNDTLIGGDGNDTLLGGAGNDILRGGAGRDRFSGGAGTDTADYTGAVSGVTVNLATGIGSGGDAEGDTYSSIENVTGGAGNDVITGDANANTLSGGAGDDRLDGGAGNDTLRGGDGNDTLIGGAGNDSLSGDAGNDRLEGGDGNDTLTGGAGADQLIGGAGTDTANYSTATASVSVNLATGAGSGGDAQGDTYSSIENATGGSAADTLTGDGNANVLSGGAGNDILDGAAGNDTLRGGDGDDVVIGGLGADKLYGDAGNDTLTGGAGNDTLDGGAGVDTAVFSGRRSDYNITYNATTGAYTIAHKNGGADGTDTVTTTERFQFSDRTITVNTPNDLLNHAPTLTPTSLSGGVEDTSVLIRASDLLAGATDFEGDALSVTALSVNPAHGALVNNGDGTWTFTPAPNFNGAAQFSYTVSDGALSANSTATMNVAGVNDTPTSLAFNGSSVSEGAAVGTVVGVATASDVDTGETLRFSFAPGQDAGGRFTIDSATGEVKVAPGLNFEANASHDVVIRVTDSGGATLDRSYTIGVTDSAENLTLTSGNDVFVDSSVTELSVHGGDGNDQITGTTGADTLFGDRGDDTLIGGAGDDTLAGGAGADVLQGGAGNDTLTGDDGTNLLVNGSFENTTGMADAGWGQTGATMQGWTLDRGPAFEAVNSGYAGIGATDGGHWLDMDASPGNVQISQVVQGVEAGSTYELSFDAASRAAAGSGGLQVFFGGQLVATIEPGAAMKNYAFEVVGGSGDGSNKLTFVGTGREDNVGASLDNVKFSAAGADTLTGGAGDDRLDGGLGTDRAVFSGASTDYSFAVNGAGEVVVTDLRAGSPDGTDTLVSIEKATFSNGTFGLVNGALGQTGRASSDIVVGGAGAETLSGGGGSDRIIAGAGDDRVYGDSGSAAANLLVNGSFENSAYSGVAFGAPIGWTQSGTANSGGLHSDVNRASDGPQYYAFGGWSGQSGGALSQTVSTVAGETYTLTFDIGVNWGAGAGALRVEALSGGDLVLSQTATDAVGGGRSFYNYTFTATSDHTTIRFTDISDMSRGDLDVDMDNVRLFQPDGADTIDGGAGVDTLDYSRSYAGVSVNLATGAGQGGEAEGDRFTNFENATGSNFADTLTGDAGNNRLDGGAGDDTLVGGAGADQLVGGAGVDTAVYSGSGASVTVNLATGAGSGGDAQGDTLTGVENVTGSAFADTLTGDAGANTLDGGAGNDVLDGGAGNDTLLGGAGDDRLSGGDGDDRLSGGAGNDQLDGGAGNDIVEGDQNLIFNGNFEASAYSGGAYGAPVGWTQGGVANSGGLHSDAGRSSEGSQYYAFGGWSGQSGGTLSQTVSTVAGETYTLTFDIGVNYGSNTGALQVDALSGSSLILSQTATDAAGGGRSYFTYTFTATSEQTTIRFTDVSDTSRGDLDVDMDNVRLVANTGGNDTLTGGDGNDTLYGDGGADSLTGGAGNDSLYGGTGDDTLAGGAGNDRLIGGTGTDTVVFTGNWSDYAISYDAASGAYTVADRRSGAPDGTDTMSGVERVQFADRTIAITQPSDLLNDAPTNVVFSGSVSENAAAGTVLGTAAGVDADAGDRLSYSFVPGQDGGGRFAIDAGTGEVKVAAGASLNFESAQSHDVTIRVTDASGATFDKTFTIAVGDQAEGLTLTAGNDVFTDVGVRETYVDGGAGNDTITGTTGADDLRGGDGNDTLNGDAGDDRLDGGTGADTLNGGSGDDVLIGGAGDDTINAGDGADNIDAGDGNDVIDGGAGNDWIITGSGDNIVRAGDGDDLVDDAWGARYTGSNDFDGGAGSDTLYGGDGADVVSGGVGNDNVFGEGGNDVVYGDGRDDGAAARIAFHGSGDYDGADFKQGDAGFISFDKLVANASINLATGDGTPAFQHFKVTAFKGGVAVGTVSVDVYGGDTAVSIDLGEGVTFDSVQVEAQEYDWWNGGYSSVPMTGLPLQISGVVMREYDGAGGNDYMTGEGGNDRMYGGAGDDRIYGDAGDDLLIGGAGADVLDGGAGTDTVDYSGSAVGVTAVFENTDSSGIGLSGAMKAGGYGGDAQGDSYNSIERVVGSDFNDRIYGSSAGMTVDLGKGDDVFDNSASSTAVDTVYAGAGDDKVFVGGGNDYVDGGAGDDQIDGEAGDDKLYGGAGQDFIQGGTGNDVIDGGEGHDRLFGQDGDDTIVGGAGYDQLFGDAGNDTLDGGADGDYLDGGDGNDTLTGGAGDDWISGGAGVDKAVFAGTSKDYQISVDASGQVIVTGVGAFAADGRDTLNGVEQIQFSDGTFNLATGAFAAASTIAGTSAADLMIGGSGADTLMSSAGGDRLIGGGGLDTASYANAGSGVVANLETGGTGGDAAGDTYSGVENLTGSAFNDTLTGDAGNNALFGGAGTDALSGGAGNDTFQFSNDFTWQNTTALERGTGVQQSIHGYVGSYDSFNGGSGIDTLNGTSGNDYISANSGSTNLIQGVEIINAGAGDDVVDLSPASFTWTDSVTVHGDAGNDVIWSDAGNDTLYGDDGNDVLRAAAGNDALYGGSGADTLYGGDGADILSGGTGNDRIYGDSGSDMLLFGLGDGSDVFSGGAGGGWVDEIHLNIDAGAVMGSDWTLTLTSGSILSTGDHQIFFSGDAAGVITLKDGSTLQFDQTEQLSWGG